MAIGKTHDNKLLLLITTTLKPDQAIVHQLLDIYIAEEEYNQDETSFLAHYLYLYADHMDSNTSLNSIVEKNLSERKERLQNEETTKITQYKEITNLDYNTVLYTSFVNDEFRMLITRWRLSCHKLRIETGRYTTPITPRGQRLCKICSVLEDEQHALFHCPIHTFVRLKFHLLLCKYNTVALILNPQCSEDIVKIGMFLREIEKNMEKHRMC